MKSLLNTIQSNNHQFPFSLRLLSPLSLHKPQPNPHLASSSVTPSHPINLHPLPHNPTAIIPNTLKPIPAKTPLLQPNPLSDSSCKNALNPLDDISHPNLTSWNLTISSYNRRSQFGESLRTFKNMQTSGIGPNQYTYWSVLSACAASQDLEFGEQVYSVVLKNGFFLNGYVSNGVVDLYAKSGSFDNALRAFSESSGDSVVCWNSIIAWGVRYGESLIALDLFCQMIEGFHMPNGFTFSSVLCACAATGDVDVGRGVHAWVVKCNAEDDIFVGTAIVDLYAKCGDMNAAVKEFSLMPVRNVVSWTAIISGFVQENDYVSSLKFFREMLRTAVEVNKCTLTSVFVACSKSLMAIETHQIHCWILKTGLLMDFVVTNALVSTYASIGDIQVSRNLFEEVDKKENPGAWLAMVSALAQNKSLTQSMELFYRMWHEGLKPDKRCSSNILSIVGCVDLGRQIHSYVVKAGLVLDVLVGSALFTMYSKCGKLHDSYELFIEMPERDQVSWTSMISGFAGHGHADKALLLFREMMFEKINPDPMTISSVLSACCDSRFFMKGREIHGHALRLGYGSDAVIGAALVTLYSRCKTLVYARRSFDGVPHKDQVIWSSLVAGYAINGYKEEALSEFHRMTINGFKIDHITSSSVLGVCAYLSRPILGCQLHSNAIKTGLIFHLIVSSALVTVYSKCGCINDSRKVFNEIENPDFVACTAMIDGYAQHGSGDESLRLFDSMIKAGVKPDSVTLVSVLSACSHCGLLEEAFFHFGSMRDRYGIEPELHHYACMVDLLGRSGMLNEAANFIQQMPIQPDFLVWSTLLAACRAHGDVEMGRLVAKKVTEMEPRDSGAYVSLSNLSADMGEWEEVTRIRSSMKGGGMKKEPGWSMV